MRVAPWVWISGAVILAMFVGLMLTVNGPGFTFHALMVAVVVAAWVLFLDCISRPGLRRACWVVAVASFLAMAPLAASLGEDDGFWRVLLELGSAQLLLYCGVVEFRLGRNLGITRSFLARAAAGVFLIAPVLLLADGLLAGEELSLVGTIMVAPALIVTAVVWLLIVLPEGSKWIPAILGVVLSLACLAILFVLAGTFGAKSSGGDGYHWTKISYQMLVDLTGDAEAPAITEHLELAATDLEEKRWLNRDEFSLDDEKKKLAALREFSSWFEGWTVKSFEIGRQPSDSQEPLWSGKATVERLNAHGESRPQGWLTYYTEFKLPEVVAENKSEMTLLLVARKFAPVKHNLGGEFQETVLNDGSIGKIVRAGHLNGIDSTVRILHASRVLQNPVLSWIAFLGTWDVALYLLAGLGSVFTFFLMIAVDVIKDSRFKPFAQRLLTRLRVISPSRTVPDAG